MQKHTRTNIKREKAGQMNNTLCQKYALIEFLNILKNGIKKNIKFRKIHFTFSEKCDTIMK